MGSDDTTDQEWITIGLLADPDEPTELAEELAEDLPRLLAERLDPGILWKVEFRRDPLAVRASDTEEILRAAREHRDREGWDLAIYLTDLPVLTRDQPVAADTELQTQVALVSLPTLGGFLMRRRVRKTVVRLVRRMVRLGGREKSQVMPAGRRRFTQRIASLRATAPYSEGLRLTAPAARGRVRLLLGMVRANRPWRLVPYLAKALAAAVATAAVAVANSTIWQLATALGPIRLGLATLWSTCMMVAWLIVHQNLWEKPADKSRNERERVALYNTSTVLTLAIGTLCCYAGLFLATLVGVLLLVDSTVFAKLLNQGSVRFVDFVSLAWLASSAATAGGALGSGFESQEAVRQAAYGVREQERRATEDQQAQRPSPGRA